MPFMCTKKDEKSALRLMEIMETMETMETMFKVSVEPREGEWTEPFEYIQRGDQDLAYVTVDDRFALIILATNALSDKR